MVQKVTAVKRKVVQQKTASNRKKSFYTFWALHGKTPWEE